MVLTLLGGLEMSLGCHHEVDAAVVASVPLPEYGMCRLSLIYTSDDGGDHNVTRDVWCSSTGVRVHGCYNHRRQDELWLGADATKRVSSWALDSGMFYAGIALTVLATPGILFVLVIAIFTAIVFALDCLAPDCLDMPPPIAVVPSSHPKAFAELSAA